MLYGMTYDEFWFGDPWIVRAYAQAYLLKRRAMNEELWLQGIYMTYALNSVIGTAFGKKKIDYVNKPLDIFEKTESEKKREIEAERQKLKEILNRWKKSADGNKGVGKDGKP